MVVKGINEGKPNFRPIFSDCLAPDLGEMQGFGGAEKMTQNTSAAKKNLMARVINFRDVSAVRGSIPGIPRNKMRDGIRITEVLFQPQIAQSSVLTAFRESTRAQ